MESVAWGTILLESHVETLFCGRRTEVMIVMVSARTICWLDGKMGDAAIAPSLPVRSLTQSETIITTTHPCPSYKEPRGHPSITVVPVLCHCLLQIRSSGPENSTVQFIFYQPIIHRWRETDFFPCSATCGGGNGVHLV